jgi:hypothetical protein
MTLQDLQDHGEALHAANRLEEAEQVFRGVLASLPSDPDALLRLATIRGQRHDYEESAKIARLLLAIEPNHAGGWCVLGAALGRLARFGEARIALDRALGLAPNMPSALWNRGSVLLSLGDFLGWGDYEWGKVNGIRPCRTVGAEWRGGPVYGTLLVWAEQGQGDTLMMCRLLKLAKERSGAREVIFECQEPLAGLMHDQGLADVVFARACNSSMPYPYDAQISLMSLPYAVGLTLDQVSGAPYLKPKGKVSLAGTGRKIGLVWHGAPTYDNDHARSMPVEHLAPLLDTPEATFYSLQLGDTPPDGVADLAAGIHDWQQTSALMMEMDLIITVDTSCAHLAGALGRPVWVMLPFAAEWRWLTERDTSPWYDSARLFRQETPGDWAGVIARVRKALVDE